MLHIERNNKIPASISLRDYLRRYLTENSISAESAGHLLGLGRSSLEHYFQGKAWQWKIAHVKILADFLQVDTQSVIDAAELDGNTENDTTNIRACSYILSHFDIKSLKAEKIIPARATIETYENTLNIFFGFNSIFEYDTVGMRLPAFSKSMRKIESEKKQRMEELWLKVASMAFDAIPNPYEYQPDVLKALLPRIRSYTKDTKNGYRKIVLALFRIGVTVITQPYLKSSGIFGTTMLKDGKPCIVVSDQGQKYYKLWLTLLHELFHVLNDFEMLEKSGCHSSCAENDVFFDEDAADRFAMQMLVPEKYIKTTSNHLEIPYLVQQVAQKLDIHPAIVYGVCFEWYHKTEHRDILKNHSVLTPIGDAITDVCFDPVKQKSVRIAIEAIKEKLYKISI
ncbi:MAG: hypothetical protein K6E73_10655 [Bacteroidales bacterium]|nr:hypothetical protein [Bacteroidales bacterium]